MALIENVQMDFIFDDSIQFIRGRNSLGADFNFLNGTTIHADDIFIGGDDPDPKCAQSPSPSCYEKNPTGPYVTSYLPKTKEEKDIIFDCCESILNQTACSDEIFECATFPLQFPPLQNYEFQDDPNDVPVPQTCFAEYRLMEDQVVVSYMPVGVGYWNVEGLLASRQLECEDGDAGSRWFLLHAGLAESLRPNMHRQVDGMMVIIMSANQSMAEMVASGIIQSNPKLRDAINYIPICRQNVKMGLRPECDTFTLVTRIMIDYANEDFYRNWFIRNVPFFRFLLLTPKRPPKDSIYFPPTPIIPDNTIMEMHLLSDYNETLQIAETLKKLVPGESFLRLDYYENRPLQTCTDVSDVTRTDCKSTHSLYPLNAKLDIQNPETGNFVRVDPLYCNPKNFTYSCNMPATNYSMNCTRPNEYIMLTDQGSNKTLYNYQNQITLNDFNFILTFGINHTYIGKTDYNSLTWYGYDKGNTVMPGLPNNDMFQTSRNPEYYMCILVTPSSRVDLDGVKARLSSIGFSPIVYVVPAIYSNDDEYQEHNLNQMVYPLERLYSTPKSKVGTALGPWVYSFKLPGGPLPDCVCWRDCPINCALDCPVDHPTYEPPPNYNPDEDFFEDDGRLGLFIGLVCAVILAVIGWALYGTQHRKQSNQAKTQAAFVSPGPGSHL